MSQWQKIWRCAKCDWMHSFEVDSEKSKLFKLGDYDLVGEKVLGSKCHCGAQLVETFAPEGCLRAENE